MFPGSDDTAKPRARQAAGLTGGQEKLRHLGRREYEIISDFRATLLPAFLPVLPQATIAARYVAADQIEAAGGDWFDAIPLADGDVAFIVGDVVGHGLAASAAMAQLRAVLNELLLAESSPAAALARVDKFAARSTALQAATVAVVVLAPSSGQMQYATCGHPAPLKIGRDGATRYLPATGSGPLGIGSQPIVETDTLEPGELLLLYSDGLVRRPGQPPATSLAELASVAASAARGSASRIDPTASAPERVCRLTAELLRRAGYADDVTTLAVQRLGTTLPSLHLEVPAEVASVRVIRRALDEWLARLEPRPDDRDDLQIAVVEIVTNAIQHAYISKHPGSIHFDAALRADGCLECAVADFGRWRAPDPNASERGNGLMVAEQLVDRLQITHPAQSEGVPANDPATVVTLVRRLTRLATLDTDDHAEVLTALDSTPFAIDIQLDGRVACAWVNGPVDLSTVDQFLRGLTTACRGGTLSLIVDLSGVSYLASDGVSALYQVARQVQRHGKTLELRAQNGSQAQGVLNIVGLPYQAA